MKNLKKAFLGNHRILRITSRVLNLLNTVLLQKEYEPNVETFGVKIKNKNVLLSDIIYLMESEEIAKIISKEFPELTLEEIEAAQRVMTVIMLGLECRRINNDK